MNGILLGIVYFVLGIFITSIANSFSFNDEGDGIYILIAIVWPLFILIVIGFIAISIIMSLGIKLGNFLKNCIENKF